MPGLKSARLWMGSLLICTWAASARADGMCEKNEDCPEGFDCTTTASSTTPECAAPCEMGKECATPPDCKPPLEWKQCTPASCESDADCGERAVCHAETISECSGGAAVACASGEMCPTPEPAPEPSCTEHTSKLCLPRYLLPCEQDQDCGAGFSCQASEECMCSGSAGSSGSASGGADAKPQPQTDFAPRPPATDAGVEASDAAVSGDPPTCECHPSALKHCELKEISCSSDAECPSDFVCVSAGGDAVTCAASPRQPDGGTADAAVCEPVETKAPAQMRCAPRGGWAAPGAVPGSDGSHMGNGPVYAEGGQGSSTSAPKDDGSSADAGVRSDLPTGDAAETPNMDSAACSASAPRAGRLRGLLVPFGFALAALGLRSRRKPR